MNMYQNDNNNNIKQQQQQTDSAAIQKITGPDPGTNPLVCLFVCGRRKCVCALPLSCMLPLLSIPPRFFCKYTSRSLDSRPVIVGRGSFHFLVVLVLVVVCSIAVLEITAFTSSYGAIPQGYHSDIQVDRSALLYARSFSPLYSLFIQLQDTPTPGMGPTSVCPGTHYCGGSNDHMTETMCQQHGFQLYTAIKEKEVEVEEVEEQEEPKQHDMEQGDWANATETINTTRSRNNTTTTTTTTKYWRAGDVLIMNMNSFHRGSAHIDPNAPDRVMVALSVGPKPRPKAESRQVSQGSLMSLRYDQWVRENTRKTAGMHNNKKKRKFCTHFVAGWDMLIF